MADLTQAYRTMLEPQVSTATTTETGGNDILSGLMNVIMSYVMMQEESKRQNEMGNMWKEWMDFFLPKQTPASITASPNGGNPWQAKTVLASLLEGFLNASDRE